MVNQQYAQQCEGISQRARQIRNLLSPATQGLLDESAGSHSDWAGPPVTVAFGVMRAGGTEEDYEEIINSSELGKSHEAAEGRIGHARAVSSAWAWAEERYEPEYSSGNVDYVREQLVDLLEVVESSAEFTRHNRPSAKALVQIGIEVGTYAVDVSIRRLAEIVGCTIKTASKHLKQIQATGLVNAVQSSGRGKAKTYVLNLNYHAPLEGAMGKRVGGCKGTTHIYIGQYIYVVSVHPPLPITSCGLSMV